MIDPVRAESKKVRERRALPPKKYMQKTPWEQRLHLGEDDR